MATRKTLVAANSQQRPELFWLVMGAPSCSILILKFWEFAIVAARVVKTFFASCVVRALSARRF